VNLDHIAAINARLLGLLDLPEKPEPPAPPAPQASQELLDIKEAAKLLGMSPKYLYRAYPQMPHIKIGAGKRGRIRFRRAQLEAYIESHSFNRRSK